MTRIIILTFVFLGLVFYELSGGADFQPRVRVANVEPKPQSGSAVRPDTETGAARIRSVPEMAQLTSAEIRTVRAGGTGAGTPQPATDEKPSLAKSTEDPGTPPPVTLVSLEQSPTRFATPLESFDSSLETGLSQFARLPAVDPENDIRSVAGSSVNLREGPGTGYPVLTSLKRGDEVEILADPGTGWVQLRLLNGDVAGWMAASLLSPPSE